MPEKYLIEYQLPLTLELIERYFSAESKLTKQLNERVHRINFTNEASYRLINYWEKEGLFSSERASGAGWRKYSLIDLIWLKLLIELRKFGYPIEALKKLKANLTEPHPLTGTEGYAYLEAYIAITVILKIPVFINILASGEYVLTTQREKRILEEIKIFTVNSHLTVSLNKLLSDVTKKDYQATNFEEQLTKEEVELLTIIRTGDFVSVNIRFKNGKIDLIESTDIVDNTERIEAILRQNDYQDIEIKRKDGKVVRIKRTIAKKLK